MLDSLKIGVADLPVSSNRSSQSLGAGIIVEGDSGGLLTQTDVSRLTAETGSLSLGHVVSGHVGLHLQSEIKH